MKFGSQKGIALINVMLVVLFTAILIEVVTTIVSSYVAREAHYARWQRARDTIAKRVQSELLNPDQIYFSAIYGDQAAKPENTVLLKCLVPPAATVDPASYCNSLPRARGRGYPFYLLTNADECKVDPFGQFNCQVAGPAGQTVGYNHLGERGALGNGYPFEARVYYIPDCQGGENDPVQADVQECRFPARMLFAFEIIFHAEFLRTASPPVPMLNFGTYPKVLTFHAVPTYRITGKSCNDGATVMGVDQNSGDLKCECRTPYQQDGTKTNELGPVCIRAVEQNCPIGSIIVGRDVKGNYQCRDVTNTGADGSFQTWVAPACVSSVNDGCPSASEVDCRHEPATNREVHGWVTGIETQCNGAVHMEYVDSGYDPDIYTKLGIIAIGIGVGLLAGAIWGALAIIPGAILGGAIAGLIASIFDDGDWHKRDGLPLVVCIMNITCQAYK